jgi:Big-like domain-containing protein
MKPKHIGIRLWGLLVAVPLAVVLVMLATTLSVQANPGHPNPSMNVVIIGGTDLLCGINSANRVVSGGCFPVSTMGPTGNFATEFTFTALSHTLVNAVTLAPFDTALLNVHSPGLNCNLGLLTPTQKQDLVNFVGQGNKLIIYDSECPPQDYSWLPFPFKTSNPGALGQTGTLTIVEENTLSSNNSSNSHYINAPMVSTSTDAVGDMNVMTTFDPNWCLDMSGTNAIHVTGPVHTYARYGSFGSVGLFIYTGLDLDFLQGTTSPNSGTPAGNLAKIWLQELQQSFNPDLLPCKAPVVGIKLDPATDSNPAGTQHTVTATVTDLFGAPVQGVAVSFNVTAGPNTGTIGVCNPPTCQTDANGQVSFTYQSNGMTGMDTIEACFTDAQGNQHCAKATKTWMAGPPAKLTLDPKAKTNPVDTKHCVTATVTDAFGNPIQGVIVRFSVTPSIGRTPSSGAVKTNASGQATFCYTSALLGPDVIHAYADVDNDQVQDPGEPFDDAGKVWTPPVSTSMCEVDVTYGGWIIAKNGDRGNFGGNAKTDQNGNPQGQEEYQDQGPAQPMNVHSINVLAVVCPATTPPSAAIHGEATIDGAGRFFYRIDLTDKGEPGTGNDTYQIRLDTGYDSGANNTLRGGNVQIHK